jgi:hypothetical protein
MKKPPLTETDFSKLMPDALDPNGSIEDNEPDWAARAVGSGVACVIAFILIFLDIYFADQVFTGRSFELAESMSYFLIAVTIGLGVYCAHAGFKVNVNKNKTTKISGARK